MDKLILIFILINVGVWIHNLIIRYSYRVCLILAAISNLIIALVYYVQSGTEFYVAIISVLFVLFYTVLLIKHLRR